MSSTQFQLKAVPAPSNGVAHEGKVIVKIGNRNLMLTKVHYEEYKAHLASKAGSKLPLAQNSSVNASNPNEKNSFVSDPKGVADKAKGMTEQVTLL